MNNLNSVAGQKAAGITATDFRNSFISNSADQCCACDKNVPCRPAPLVIKDGHYCLWCAIEIARTLLTRKRVPKKQPRLYIAARLVLEEHDDLIDSAPRRTLFRLEQIAKELEEIEDRL